MDFCYLQNNKTNKPSYFFKLRKSCSSFRGTQWSWIEWRCNNLFQMKVYLDNITFTVFNYVNTSYLENPIEVLIFYIIELIDIAFLIFLMLALKVDLYILNTRAFFHKNFRIVMTSILIVVYIQIYCRFILILVRHLVFDLNGNYWLLQKNGSLNS